MINTSEVTQQSSDTVVSQFMQCSMSVST